MDYAHIPVMRDEVLAFVRPKEGGYYIDCTLGGGGYTLALSDLAKEKGLVLAFDLDKKAIDNMLVKKPANVHLINDSFANIKEQAGKIVGEDCLFDGIVMDLGLSSAQIDDPERGFSFKYANSLDMSFSGNSDLTKKLLNFADEKTLSQIIKEYGEERFSKQIAAKIVAVRKEKTIKNAEELSLIVVSAIPEKFRHGKTHPATKTFQALRIKTNEEIEALKSVLPQALSLLKKGGVLAVVSFHSLEDRIVKDFFKKESLDCLCPPSFPVCRCGHYKTLKLLAKKPIEAGQEEVDKNPRSRSAKLRAAERV